MSLEQIRRAFSAFDTDQSGSLSRSELEHILTQPVAGHPPALTSAEVEELIHRFDVNGDGELQIDEFVQAYRLLTESAVREDATRALEHASGLAGAAEDASSHGSQWTLRGWLQALPTSAALASVLHQSAGGAPSEIDLVRQIRGRDQMLALLKAGDTLEQLADVLWEGVETLMASAAESAIELQEKFLLAGAGLMSYGDLGMCLPWPAPRYTSIDAEPAHLHTGTFYRGLEGKVGTPSPRVGEAMESEHTACGDAQVKFATGNYGVVTTSEIEWRFVAKPDRPPHDGWPLESKLSAAKNSMLHGSSGAGGTSSRLKRLPTVLRGGADFRQPLLLHDLDARMHDKNDSLHELNEPKLTIEETFGSRLYTGLSVSDCAHPRQSPHPIHPNLIPTAPPCPTFHSIRPHPIPPPIPSHLQDHASKSTTPCSEGWMCLFCDTRWLSCAARRPTLMGTKVARWTTIPCGQNGGSTCTRQRSTQSTAQLSNSPS